MKWVHGFISIKFLHVCYWQYLPLNNVMWCVIPSGSDALITDTKWLINHFHLCHDTLLNYHHFGIDSNKYYSRRLVNRYNMSRPVINRQEYSHTKCPLFFVFILSWKIKKRSIRCMIARYKIIVSQFTLIQFFYVCFFLEH